MQQQAQARSLGRAAQLTGVAVAGGLVCGKQEGSNRGLAARLRALLGR
jgi:hypothetical protein